MARLPRPVTKIMSVMPAAAASSTAYWMSGLSTIGSISLGEALVTGRKRVPRPATGKTAFVIFISWVRHELCAEQFEELFFVQHAHAEFLRAIELRPRLGAGDHVVGLLRDRSGHLAARRLDALLRLVARHRRERAGEDHNLTREGSVLRPALGLAL